MKPDSDSLARGRPRIGRSTVGTGADDPLGNGEYREQPTGNKKQRRRTDRQPRDESGSENDVRHDKDPDELIHTTDRLAERIRVATDFVSISRRESLLAPEGITTALFVQIHIQRLEFVTRNLACQLLL